MQINNYSNDGEPLGQQYVVNINAMFQIINNN